MKRLDKLASIICVLVAAALGATQGMGQHAHAAACTPNWRTAQRKSLFIIYYEVYVPLGSVTLQRDGCGDIRATTAAYAEGRSAQSGTLTITNVTANTTVYFSTTFQGSELVKSILSPTFSGYGGTGIAVTGSLTVSPFGTVSATTTTDYGN